MSNWIKVSDKLPDKCDIVLVTDGTQITLAFLNGNNIFTQIISHDSWMHDLITHWQPMPRLPEQEDA